MSHIPWETEIKKWEHSQNPKNDIEKLTVEQLIEKLQKRIDELKMESNYKETLHENNIYDSYSDEDE